MSQQDVVGGIDFPGETFVVKSALIGTDYVVKTESGEELVWAKRSYFADDLRYVYSDEDDETLFRFERPGGEESHDRFVLVEDRSEEPLAVIERTDTDTWHQWQVSPVDKSAEQARVVGESGWIPALTSQRGRHMTVFGADDVEVGSVDRRTLAVHFMFDVELPGLSGVTKAAVLLSVPPLYDAMQEGPSAPWLED